VLVIGIEPNWTERVATGIAKTGKPVHALSIEGHGELTGGEHLLYERCVDDEVRGKFQRLYDDYLAMIEATGANLLGSQPTQGNIAGGLSTIEEKALGNIVKMGTVPVAGALESAEAPTVPGLHFMDTSSAAAECVTLMAAGGGVLNMFPTGQATSSATRCSRSSRSRPTQDGRDDG